MEFSQLVERAMEVRAWYEEFERKQYGNSWSNEELALGFVGDVGDLAKLVMAVNGRRNIPDAESKFAHELSDCFWSIIVLAHVHGIDLENAFLKTIDELDQHLKETNSA